MQSKEAVLAVLCGIAGIFMAVVLFLVGERLPSTVVYYTVAVVVLGAALVLTRYDRLGPFEGELGPPRHESAIRDLILRESQRALPYGGEYAVIIVRRPKDKYLSWNRVIRASDTVVHCRRRQSVVVLPETTREGSIQLAGRLDAAAGAPVSIALIHFPGDNVAAENLCPTLLGLIRGSSVGMQSQRTLVESSSSLARPAKTIQNV